MEQFWFHGICRFFFETKIMCFLGLFVSSPFLSPSCCHQDRERGEGKQEEPCKNMQISDGTEIRIIFIFFFLVAVSLGVNATSAALFWGSWRNWNVFPPIIQLSVVAVVNYTITIFSSSLYPLDGACVSLSTQNKSFCGWSSLEMGLKCCATDH